MHVALIAAAWIYRLDGFKMKHKEDKGTHIAHSQYHGCWYLGDARSQGISSHGIDRGISRKRFSIGHRKLKILWMGSCDQQESHSMHPSLLHIIFKFVTIYGAMLDSSSYNSTCAYLCKCRHSKFMFNMHAKAEPSVPMDQYFLISAAWIWHFDGFTVDLIATALNISCTNGSGKSWDISGTRRQSVSYHLCTCIFMILFSWFYNKKIRGMCVGSSTQFKLTRYLGTNTITAEDENEIADKKLLSLLMDFKQWRYDAYQRGRNEYYSEIIIIWQKKDIWQKVKWHSICRYRRNCM